MLSESHAQLLCLGSVKLTLMKLPFGGPTYLNSSAKILTWCCNWSFLYRYELFCQFTGSLIMSREPDGAYYAKRPGRQWLNLCLKSNPHYSPSATKLRVPKALQLIVLPIPVSQPNQSAYCYKHKHTVLILNMNVIYCIRLSSIFIYERLFEQRCESNLNNFCTPIYLQIKILSCLTMLACYPFVKLV